MNRASHGLAVAAVTLVFACNAGADEPDHFPRLAAEAKDVAGFIPKGWADFEVAVDQPQY